MGRPLYAVFAKFPSGPAAFTIVLVVCLSIISCWYPPTAQAAQDAPSAVMILTAWEDSTISSQYPNTNCGSEGYLVVATQSSDAIGVYFHDRSLLKFDLSVLPDGVAIDSATLQVSLETSSGAASVSLWAFPVTEAWSESTVTWNNQPAFDTSVRLSRQ